MSKEGKIINIGKKKRTLKVAVPKKTFEMSMVEKFWPCRRVLVHFKRIKQNKGKESENLPEIEEITEEQAHGNCIEIF